METHIIPYSVNSDEWWSGVDIVNVGSLKADIVITYRNEQGLELGQETFSLQPWEHMTFIPHIQGRFTTIVESADGVMVTRMLGNSEGGLSEWASQ